jgi:hydroxyacylglutathione hydrolase
MAKILPITLSMPLGMGKVNCYLVETSTGHLLIDTGIPAARKELLEKLENNGCTPESLKLVILTHGDFDHTGNAAHLRASCGAKLAMHRDDSGMAERADMFVNRNRSNRIIKLLMPILSGFGKSERFTPDVLLEDGTDLNEYGLDARIITLPGHSKGSIGILTTQGELICGDFLVSTKGPRLNSLMDDQAAAKVSMEKLAGMNISTIYPGHGQPFSGKMLEQIRAEMG